MRRTLAPQATPATFLVAAASACRTARSIGRLGEARAPTRRPFWLVRQGARDPADAFGDDRRGLANPRYQIEDAAGRDSVAGCPDFQGGNDGAARVEHGHCDRVHG
jgi:hypothetical protein